MQAKPLRQVKAEKAGKTGFKFDADTLVLNHTDTSSEELRKKDLKNLVYPPSGTPRLVRVMIQMKQPSKHKNNNGTSEEDSRGRLNIIKSDMYVIAISRKKLRNAFTKIPSA